MTQPKPQELRNDPSRKQIRFRVAIVWGLLIGSLTFAVGSISTISENPILGIAQKALMILLLPGLIGAGAISGNMHAFELAPGALINAALNFGLSWLFLALVGRFRRTKNALVIIGLILLSGAATFAQMAETDAFQAAKHLYRAGRLAEAERGFRQLVSDDPSNVAAHMYLGQTLFREQKFSDTIAPYEKVRDLEKAGAKLNLTQHRIVGDQLSMAYGISGRTAESKALLKELVRTDPEYPLNYYNLACVAADEGDKPGVLKNLTVAFEHRAHILPGEQMPNPASDPSFQKYAHDTDFKELVSHLKR